jgi:exopolysaccharide biosynthesis polyprenyl glycosylphosphotransferase
MSTALKDIHKKSKKTAHIPFEMIFSVVSEAKEFINGCREDLEQLSFIHRFEKLKSHKFLVKSRIKTAVNKFVVGFPRSWRLHVKSYTDYLFVTIIAVFALPVMCVVALLVKLTSKGPALYAQERVGKNGRPFMIYKFRSMKIDAEKESGPVWAQDDDPRLTCIGNFLRKSHLDELPQLINVIKGDMSLIGPRPERPFFVSKFKTEIDNYEKRLEVKPGITGLAQVRHKYDETIDDVKHKIRYDIMYIKKMCLMLDLKVLMWTVGVVLTGKGAH